MVLCGELKKYYAGGNRAEGLFKDNLKEWDGNNILYIMFNHNKCEKNVVFEIILGHRNQEITKFFENKNNSIVGIPK